MCNAQLRPDHTCVAGPGDNHEGQQPWARKLPQANDASGHKPVHVSREKVNRAAPRESIPEEV